jgi:CheY-like chemotaxis protein
LSLTGNLEDLPLLDIIQIVSFSKKTGYLTIRADAGESAIVFEHGSVVSSFTWDSQPLDPTTASLPPPKRNAVLRKRVEMALAHLIRLREGQFSFSLTDETPKRIGPRDLVPETLDPGINAQELLLDLARGIDEDRRDSSAALEASFAQPVDEPIEESGPDATVAAFVKGAPPPPELEELAAASTLPIATPPPPPAPEAAPPTEPTAPTEIRVVLLVDDEEDVRHILADHFIEAGYEVVEAEDPEAAVKKANRLGKAGVRFILVADLGMPTSGGSSFQGGFEVVKRLGKMGLQPPVLLMTESSSGALRARAKQMGISSFIFKPGLSKLDSKQFAADLKAFAGKIAGDVLPRMARAEAPPPKPKGQGPASTPKRAPLPATADDGSRDFSILQKHLLELGRTLEPTQISTLVMKVAREFFERGILFLVKNEEVRGLGGFGAAPRDESLNLVVRDIVIPLSEPSPFLDAVGSRKPKSGTLPDGKWTSYFFGKIGRFKSGGAALFPLLAHRETIAFLFGDNPETGREFGRLDALEVFINQAGVALENAFLQRKLETFQRPE